MIYCVCVDDTGKPAEIPNDKWVVLGESYHIVFVAFLEPNGDMAYQLKEIDLNESCAPYEYFSANRFIFKTADYDNMFKLINESQMIRNAIADVQGIKFEIFDGTNDRIDDKLRDLDSAIKIIDTLNECGEYPPYHMRKSIK